MELSKNLKNLKTFEDFVNEEKSEFDEYLSAGQKKLTPALRDAIGKKNKAAGKIGGKAKEDGKEEKEEKDEKKDKKDKKD